MNNKMKIDEIKRKGQQNILRAEEKNGVLFFTFPVLNQIEWLTNAFSTRIGGVSRNELASMNLSFTRGDDEACVRENFHRMADAAGFVSENMVFSQQTHTTNVRVVTMEDKGKGFCCERDYTDVDGLVTNVPGLVLSTFYADCVPLYFVDQKHHAIGLSHSGWKGTVNNIAAETIRVMHDQYGTEAKDLLTAIGPSICQDCYEVSEDVIEQFQSQYEQKYWKKLFYRKENGKYQLNLWEACRINFLREGVLEENISVTDICTCCNPEILFSHRASHGKRGNLAAFLSIRK